MNVDLNQHQACISAPNDSSKVSCEAIVSMTGGGDQSRGVVSSATDSKQVVFPNDKKNVQSPGKLYGMPLVWKGLRLLGVAIGIAGVWYVAAWIKYGQQPMTEGKYYGLGGPSSPILPPDWLVAIVGLVAIISLFMMLVGTQDANPRMRSNRNKSPNKASDATSGPAPDAVPSSHQG